MNITLTSQQTHNLAETFAEVIHGQVIQRHLELTGSPKYRDMSFRDMQDAIHSIADPQERRDFILAIGWHWRRLRAERCTDIRARDYVARVHVFRASERARRPAACAA